MAVLERPPPLGSRLWLYTNFDCNLACDYCCARSSPRAAARRLPLEIARRACEEFAGLGGRELLLTGGEPFLDPELPRLVGAAARWMPVTILTNAMLIGRGSRRRTLDALDPTRVTMQVSLDSGTPALHDRHRGHGAFDRARAGIALLRELGFHVRVAATVEESDAAEEAGFHATLDADGIPSEHRLVRRVARAGFADHGLELSLNTLWPEPAVAADGLVAPGRDRRPRHADRLDAAADRHRARRHPRNPQRSSPRPRHRARGLPLHLSPSERAARAGDVARTSRPRRSRAG